MPTYNKKNGYRKLNFYINKFPNFFLKFANYYFDNPFLHLYFKLYFHHCRLPRLYIKLYISVYIINYYILFKFDQNLIHIFKNILKNY